MVRDVMTGMGRISEITWDHPPFTDQNGGSYCLQLRVLVRRAHNGSQLWRCSRKPTRWTADLTLVGSFSCGARLIWLVMWAPLMRISPGHPPKSFAFNTKAEGKTSGFLKNSPQVSQRLSCLLIESQVNSFLKAKSFFPPWLDQSFFKPTP
jgi:hypothetical protein